jgi:hypothetical protein
MEEDIEPTDDDIQREPMLQLFKYKHLRDEIMRATSRHFCALARQISTLPRNPERTASLRKLREAKDCAITALLWK